MKNFSPSCFFSSHPNFDASPRGGSSAPFPVPPMRAVRYESRRPAWRGARRAVTGSRGARGREAISSRHRKKNRMMKKPKKLLLASVWTFQSLRPFHPWPPVLCPALCARNVLSPCRGGPRLAGRGRGNRRSSRLPSRCLGSHARKHKG